MTWLRGQTTWANLLPKITSLACGESSDDFGATVPAIDRWVRDIAGTDYLRAPDVFNYTPPAMKQRAGYWAATAFKWGTTTASYQTAALIPGAQTTTCRTTAINTAQTTVQTWEIRVNTANSVAGVYNTANISVLAYANDNTTNPVFNSTASLTAAGDLVLTQIGTVRLSDPSGLLQAAAVFHRTYTPVYRGGIDWFGPEAWRRVAAPTFSINPPGTQGTDWAYTDTSGVQVPVTNVNVGTAGMIALATREDGLIGVGHKTAASLTGAMYEYTFPMSQFKARFTNAIGGRIALAVGGFVTTTTGTLLTHGQPLGTYPAWLVTHRTAGSVTPGSLVQYWMSVKSGGLKVICNADPGQTGVSTCNWIAPLVRSYSATLDPFNFAWGDDTSTEGNTSTDSFGGVLAHTLYSSLKRTDGSEGRDYQTGWGRCDLFRFGALGGVTGDDTFQEWLKPSSGGASNGKTCYAIGILPDRNSISNAYSDAMSPATSKPSPIDGTWWLGTIVLSEAGISAGSGATSVSVPPSNFGPRGSLSDKILYLPGSGWQNGDELTDTATGKKYFLTACDFHGIFGRQRPLNSGSGALTGGVAVLEE